MLCILAKNAIVLFLNEGVQLFLEVLEDEGQVASSESEAEVERKFLPIARSWQKQHSAGSDQFLAIRFHRSVLWLVRSL
mgnify:FL=1